MCIALLLKLILGVEQLQSASTSPLLQRVSFEHDRPDLVYAVCTLND